MIKISEYGLKISNIKAATLWCVNAGLRNKYEKTDAMINNSLFLDYLRSIGLRDYKGETTRDVICLDFGFGTRSYEEEIKHLAKQKTDEETYKQILDNIEKNKDKFIKYTKQELRELFYAEGVDVQYADGEVIHYKMLYRNPSKAKVGQVMFINEKLYDKAYDWITMGLCHKKPDKIVEMSAYAPLTTSSIVGKLHIDLDDVLIVRDQSSFFRTVAKIVRADENKNCYVADEEADVENVIWDGMALIDTDICPEYVNGMALLRNHFFKACAFRTDIKLFFRDWCAEHKLDYETYTVKDMFGHDRRVADIKLITTNKAIKWEKFTSYMGDDPYAYWKDRVREDGCVWGVVKTDHPSKLGDVQQMSYQMVNTMPCNKQGIFELGDVSVRFVNDLKYNPEVFADWLRKNENATNHYGMMVELYERNPYFANSKWFRAEKVDIIKGYINKLKTGKITVHGDNLTMCGNPYALLLHCVGEDWRKDPTLAQEDGVIQCYTTRFADGEYLCAIRNPHNSPNNIAFLHNHYSEEMERYFPFSKNIIAVNCIGTDIQSRLNGADFDSDFILVTNHAVAVSAAMKAYQEYPTIVNELKESGITYKNTPKDYALMDNRFARSQLAIGESSNVAQLAMSYFWDNPCKELYDNFVILSVLAQAAIDSIKRIYEVDVQSEINRIKKLPSMVREKRLPYFMKYTKKVPKMKNGKERAWEDVKKIKKN